MIKIKPLKLTKSSYKMLKFYFDDKEVGIGDTLIINDVKPTEYLKLMIHENGYIEIWTEDIDGKETKINWGEQNDSKENRNFFER